MLGVASRSRVSTLQSRRMPPALTTASALILLAPVVRCARKDRPGRRRRDVAQIEPPLEETCGDPSSKTEKVRGALRRVRRTGAETATEFGF